jgi:general secretion pathway protein L
MDVRAILSDWLEELAAAFAEIGRRRRTRRTVLLRQEGQSLVARRAAKVGAPIVAAAVGERFAGEALDALRKSLVTFELGPSDFVTRRLTVPAQARDVLPGIVRNQIDRLSPWPAASVVYGFDASLDKADTKSLDVRLLVSPRKTIEAVRNRLAETGLSLDRIVAAGPDGAALTLWTRPVAAPGARFFGSPKSIAVALAAFLVASAATTLWAALSAGALSAEQTEIAARIDAIRRHVATRSTQTAAAPSRNPAEQAWALKESAPTAVATLEALTKALPDSAYLTELSLERATLRMAGFAADPPPLIAALEKTERFSGAHFFAATTKNADSGLYRFAIETQVTSPAGAKDE